MLTLVINPGSTSTKLAVYDDGAAVFEDTLRHSPEELKAEDMEDQLAFRIQVIKSSLSGHGVVLSSLSAVIARGGLMRPLEGGTYSVNQRMLNDLRSKIYGDHASNLGAWIAVRLTEGLDIPCYVADPVVVDELSDMARISGCPDIERISIFHALNQKAVARRYAKSIGKRYEDMDLIVAHMGGGISVGAHEKGRVIDVNNTLDGDGPFSAGRAGSVPMSGLAKLCFSGRFGSADEVIHYMITQCGLLGYLGTTNGMEISARASGGDEHARFIYETMAYQVSREIGGAAATLSGRAEAVILTGGLANDALFTGFIKDRISFIAPVVIMPGEDEMTALNEAARRVLTGEETVREY